MAIRQVNRISTYNRYKLLQKALFHPEQASDSLILACRSQRALADLHIPDAEIYPLSKNTMQKAADVVVEAGGWKKLDELRCVLRTCGEENPDWTRMPRRSTRRDLIERIVTLEQHVRRIEKDRVRLKHAHYELLMVVLDSAKIHGTLPGRLHDYATNYGPEWMTALVSEYRKKDKGSPDQNPEVS